MGTHVSKVRSLTLDSFKDLELRYLIKHNLRNDTVNEIYEEIITKQDRIDCHATDLQRSRFINEKYIEKKFVKVSHLDYDQTLKSVIKGIHSESIHLLQRAIAQSDLSLRKLSQQYNVENEKNQTNVKNVSLFKYSLKHNVKRETTLVFSITEFLLINDLLIDQNIPTDIEAQRRWPHEALEYWNNKLDIYGDVFLSIKTSTKSTTQDPQTSSSSSSMSRSKSTDHHKKRGSSMKRWSLASIPKAPQNIISMHKSLKRKKEPSSSATANPSQSIPPTTTTASATASTAIASPPSVP